MFEINVTGVFMTAQAVARHMIASGKGGSIVLIGSMSGTVANRVSILSPLSPLSPAFPSTSLPPNPLSPGPHLPRLQRLQGRRPPAGAQPRLRMGDAQYPRQQPVARLHRHADGA